jgi:hypothetical protein
LLSLLTGGEQVLSRSRLGGLVRAVSTPAVQAFTRATERLGELRDRVVTVSLDEHAIARFTRKFRILKGQAEGVCHKGGVRQPIACERALEVLDAIRCDSRRRLARSRLARTPWKRGRSRDQERAR